MIEEGGRYFSPRIFEWGKYFKKSVLMGKNAAQWLMKNTEHTVVGVNSKKFFTFRDVDIAYTLRRSSNSFGHFLLLTKLKVGGFRRAVITRRQSKKWWEVFWVGMI